MKTFKIAGGMALLAGLAAAGAAMALPEYHRAWVHYSDATYTTAVGYSETECDGTVTTDGTQTAYRIRVINEPCNPDAPDWPPR